ncbi:MAG: exonuclease SbcCD subunit D C-terminal domain-containing protein, partial [Eubacteriales bacterium]|nr:exonuclease SbcCD subunit D C-terminal domain-containing protein [Eubacteriales bacterium]
ASNDSAASGSFIASNNSAASCSSDSEAILKDGIDGTNTPGSADPNSIRPVRLEDEYGALNVYLFPYIHPSVIRAAWPEETIGSWTEAMEVLIRHANVDPAARNIAVAHQYVTADGVRPRESDSEQKHIGGLDNVEYSVFDAFDYAALGHLHGPQHIGRDTVRYAGSPLKYSFSEENQKKSVTVVEIKEKGSVEITGIPLAAKRDLKTLRGRFRELMSPEYTAPLSSEDYYRIILTDEQDVDHAISRLRKYFYTNLMVLEYDNARTKAHGVTEAQEETPEKEPSEILEELYLKQNGVGMSDFQKELAAGLIDEIWNRHDQP